MTFLLDSALLAYFFHFPHIQRRSLHSNIDFQNRMKDALFSFPSLAFFHYKQLTIRIETSITVAIIIKGLNSPVTVNF